MASTVTICAVFTICILLTGTIAPALLIQEVDAKTTAKVTSKAYTVEEIKAAIQHTNQYHPFLEAFAKSLNPEAWSQLQDKISKALKTVFESITPAKKKP